MIDTKLLVKFNTQSIPTSFVAIACRVDNKKATHSALLIRLNSINYLHHFPGNTLPEVIENFNEDGWYLYKILDAFKLEDESEIGAVLQHCKRICNQSKITYSYIADGSIYNDKGIFISRLGLIL
jgi:hypothetical protein